ncbi:FixH family protein, partial [Salmonella sp. SAL4447]|uniref:FixH family protein n=1 Tax=Salmonella sp. SAL4447 TaxID=3159902 RepID=UPI00397AAA65
FKQGEMHSWVISLKSPQGAPVEDATFAIDGGMPQHHHGLPTSPAVTSHLGEGKYRLEGVKFHTSGWWELRLAIDSAAGGDQATFNIVL